MWNRKLEHAIIRSDDQESCSSESTTFQSDQKLLAECRTVYALNKNLKKELAKISILAERKQEEVKYLAE